MLIQNFAKETAIYRRIEAVFFDLDGTLLDTAPDLVAACNQILHQYNLPEAPYPEFRHWIHGGTGMMICNSFQIDASHPDYTHIKTAFLHSYQQRLTKATQLFSGINQVLNYLEQEHIPWGIITNKHTYLTQPLLSYFNLTYRCCCIISGDTLPTAKPHPAPLLYACELTHTQPGRCIYIGDTPSDIEAAQAAGMQSIAVSYGYLPKNANPFKWRADAVVATPGDLLSTLQKWK